MSPTTGNLSLQFHVIFDNEFSTLPFLRQQRIPPHWSKIVKQSCYLAIDQAYEISNSWDTLPAPNHHTPHVPVSEGTAAILPTHNAPLSDNDYPQYEGHYNPGLQSIAGANQPENDSDLTMPSFFNPDTIGLRRSSRPPKPKTIFNLASFLNFLRFL